MAASSRRTDSSASLLKCLRVADSPGLEQDMMLLFPN